MNPKSLSKPKTAPAKQETANTDRPQRHSSERLPFKDTEFLTQLITGTRRESMHVLLRWYNAMRPYIEQCKREFVDDQQMYTLLEKYLEIEPYQWDTDKHIVEDIKRLGYRIWCQEQITDDLTIRRNRLRHQLCALLTRMIEVIDVSPGTKNAPTKDDSEELMWCYEAALRLLLTVLVELQYEPDSTFSRSLTGGSTVQQWYAVKNDAESKISTEPAAQSQDGYNSTSDTLPVHSSEEDSEKATDALRASDTADAVETGDQARSLTGTEARVASRSDNRVAQDATRKAQRKAKEDSKRTAGRKVPVTKTDTHASAAHNPQAGLSPSAPACNVSIDKASVAPAASASPSQSVITHVPIPNALPFQNQKTKEASKSGRKHENDTAAAEGENAGRKPLNRNMHTSVLPLYERNIATENTKKTRAQISKAPTKSSTQSATHHFIVKDTQTTTEAVPECSPIKVNGAAASKFGTEAQAVQSNEPGPPARKAPREERGDDNIDNVASGAQNENAERQGTDSLAEATFATRDTSDGPTRLPAESPAHDLAATASDPDSPLFVPADPSRNYEITSFQPVVAGEPEPFDGYMVSSTQLEMFETDSYRLSKSAAKVTNLEAELADLKSRMKQIKDLAYQ